MSKFRKIVETALKRTEYAKMIQYVEYHTAALYNWINSLKFNVFEQNFKTSINGIAIEIMLVDEAYQIIGYSTFDKTIHIALNNPNDFNKSKLRLSVEHEFMHAYHDLVLHLPMKKEYDFSKPDLENEIKKYYNSEEEFNTHSEELLYFIIWTTNSALPNASNEIKLNYANNTKQGVFNSLNTNRQLEYTPFLKNLTSEHLKELNDYLDQELEYYYKKEKI